MLNVGIYYLEYTFPTEVNDEEVIDCFACAGSVLNTKRAASRILKDLFQSEDFKSRFCDGAEFGSLLDQSLGSRSFRKCASKYTCCNGYNRDGIDLQGRYKYQKNQVDTYVETNVQYPDAILCAALCVGGAVRYKVMLLSIGLTVVGCTALSTTVYEH